MFTKPIRIMGKHAEILKKYSQDKQAEEKLSFTLNNHDGKNEERYIFPTMIDCMMVATMLGIVNKKTAIADNGKGVNATIFADILMKKRGVLERIYHHMIFANQEGLEANAIVKKAFHIMNEEEKKEALAKFEEYMRGGLEIIDEKFRDITSYEDLCNAFIDLKQTYSVEN